MPTELEAEAAGALVFLVVASTLSLVVAKRALAKVNASRDRLIKEHRLPKQRTAARFRMTHW